MNCRSQPSRLTSFRPCLVLAWLVTQKIYGSLDVDEIRRLKGHTTKPRALQANAGCPVPQDVVFLIDSSASIAAGEFEQAKAFVLKCLDGLSVPPVSIGVIRFEDEYDVILERELNKAAAIEKVKAIAYQVGETQMGPPLQVAGTLFTTRTPNRTVVVVTDGNPNDWDATRTSADALRNAGIRLMFVTVGSQEGSDSLLREIASSPADENVVAAESYDALPEVSATLLRKIDLPCPCSASQVANVSVGNLSALIPLTADLQHGSNLSSQCEDFFPGFWGPIVLSCNDSSLTAQLECTGGCLSSMQVSVSVADLNVQISPAADIMPGESQELKCGDFFPGYRGQIVLSCRNQALTAVHSCNPVCDADAEALVIMGTQEAYVSPLNEMLSGGSQQRSCADVFVDGLGSIELACQDGQLVATSNCLQRCSATSWVVVNAGPAGVGQEIQLMAPENGLDTGQSFTWPCSKYLGDSSEGAVGAVCVNGKLYPFARCSERLTTLPLAVQASTPCPALTTETPATQTMTQQASTNECVCTSILDFEFNRAVCANTFLAACCVAVVSFLGCIYLCCKLFRLRSAMRKKQTEVIPLPKPAPEPPKPAPEPPKPKPAPLPPPKEPERPQEIIRTQTVQPTTYVELIRGSQVPLDVVFCIDSSASVGASDFQKATQFLNEVVEHMELPVVQVGLIQFNDRLPFPFAAGITGDRSVLKANIQCMKFTVGETKMAPPLQAAAQMLFGSGRAANKLIFVLTDGDPNDLAGVREAVQEVKKQGIRLVFAHVGPLATPTIMEELASAPAESNVMHLDGYNVLVDAAASVLTMIVEVSMLVHRAKCNATFPPYTVVPDISVVEGCELMCPGWIMDDKKNWIWDVDSGGIIHDQKTVSWSPHEKSRRASLKDAGGALALTFPLCGEELQDAPLLNCSEKIGMYDEISAINDSMEGVTLSLEATLEATGEPTMRVGMAQTEIIPLPKPAGPTEEVPEPKKPAPEPPKPPPAPLPPPEKPKEPPAPEPTKKEPAPEPPKPKPPPAPERKDVAVQSGPLVRAKLATGRHVPMDVVFCLDSSASVCFLKGGSAEGGAVVESGNFERAKGFVDRFVQECDMPEIHFGLIRFEDQAMVFSEMTGKKSEFSSRLRQMPFSVGETRMAAPLQQAKSLLQGTCRAVKKVVIIITDGDPNDYDDTVVAVETLRAMGARLLFLKVGGRGNTERLRNLMAVGKGGAANSAVTPGLDVLEVKTYGDLQAFVPEVLQRLVEATCWVHRASVRLTMPPYEVVDDLMDEEGFELDLNGHQIKDDSIVPWHLALMKQCEGDAGSGAPPCESSIEAMPLRPAPPSGAVAAGAQQVAQLEDDDLFSLEKQAEVLRKNLATALRSTEQAIAQTKQKSIEINKAVSESGS